ncbi:MAG: ABC transporter permease, partial [Myxococcota bacterium]
PGPRRAESARTRAGIAPVLLAIAATAALVVEIVALVQWPALARASVAMRDGTGEQEPVIALGLVGAFGALLFLQLVFIGWSLLRARKLQPGTPGKGRIAALARASGAHALSTLVTFALLFRGVHASVEAGFAFDYSLDEARLALGSDLLPALIGSAASYALTAISVIIAIVAAWFLLPKLARAITWATVDLGLIGAFLWARSQYEWLPEGSELAQLVGPMILLAITTPLVIRVAVRMTPLLMQGLERTGFHLLVAARHLRSKKSGFLATIASLSILAVSVSSCMLTSVLSVMGGFRDDLQRKILGNHAHVVVDGADSRPFEGWEPVLEKVRDTPGILGASPFLEGEVMATSASNRESVVLRGILPEALVQVTDLEDNLTSGSLEYLRVPEELLELPPSARRFPIRTGDLFPDEGDDAPPNDGPNEGSSLLREIDELIDVPPDAEDDVRALRDAMDGDSAARRALDALDAPRRNEDVLPSIVVGKELARSLRLFVGDEIDIISPFGRLGPTGPMPKSRRFRVAAIFYTGMYEYDMKLAYVLLDSAQSFLNRGDTITGIEAKVGTIEEAASVADRVRSRLGIASTVFVVDEGETAQITAESSTLRVRDWQELNKNLFGALALEKLAMFVTLGIAILIAGFCVFGTLTLMVQEKSREVGILKAMGSRSKDIVALFLFEGFLIGVYGAV